MRTSLVTVAETPFFERKAATLIDEEEHFDLVAFLAQNPDIGDVIPETGGVRKIRWAAQGRGKRGGFRVIYYFHNEAYPLLLLTIYAKNQKANLTPAERSEFKKLTALFVKKYPKGRKS